MPQIRANYEELRSAGAAAVRRRLEVLVNDGTISLEAAIRLYRQVFHMELKAVKLLRPGRIKRFFGWLLKGGS